MRYRARKSKHRLPAKLRTLPIRGRGEDAGRWFRCQHCGFACSRDRERLEGANALAGNSTQIAIAASAIDGTDQKQTIAVMSGDLNFYQTALKAAIEVGASASFPFTFLHTFSEGLGDVYQEAQPITHAFEPTTSFGCPNCGTTNWKG